VYKAACRDIMSPATWLVRLRFRLKNLDARSRKWSCLTSVLRIARLRDKVYQSNVLRRCQTPCSTSPVLDGMATILHSRAKILADAHGSRYKNYLELTVLPSPDATTCTDKDACCSSEVRGQRSRTWRSGPMNGRHVNCQATSCSRGPSWAAPLSSRLPLNSSINAVRLHHIEM
jgi:hypothetical protein